MTDGPPQRRSTDDDDRDWRDYRQRITGNEPELRVGVGNWALTLTGRDTITLIVVFALLGLTGWHVLDVTKTTAETQALISKTAAEIQATIVSALDKISARNERIFRISLCIARLTPVEVKDWRERTLRDPQAALWVYCPELMVPTP